MEPSQRVETELPGKFHEVSIDHLAVLIGALRFLPRFHSSKFYLADMLERLMTHNDRIPLSP